MKYSILVMLAVIGLMAHAATLPEYRAADSLGKPGYSNAPAADGTYVVLYTGDPDMAREQVAQYALLRAAEFTQRSGYQWFTVLNKKLQTVKLSTKSIQLRSGAAGEFNLGGGYVDMNRSADEPTVFQVVVVIKMGKGNKESLDAAEKIPDTFIAKSIAADIRAKMAAK